MVFVSAALADDADDRAAAAIFGRIRRGDKFEFLKRIDRRAGHLRGQLLHVFGDGIVVDAIEKKVVLKLAHAMDVEPARAPGARASSLVGIALALYAGDENREIVPAA